MIVLFQRRDLIISYLRQLYNQTHPDDEFKLYYKEELNLEPYTTREKDKEKGISKIPKEDITINDKEVENDYLSDDSNLVEE